MVGRPHLVEDPELVASYVVDWTGRFAGGSPAVVRPGTPAEVAAVLALCAEHGVAVVPQGGNTGLVGGGVPLEGELVVTLRRLDEVGPVDPAAGQLTAGAGATVAAVQGAARAAGWDYGIDLASRDSATVGGTVATNAGGLRVVRFGDTRRQLAGIEAALGTGSLVSHLGGLRKDNTGYHLPSLLCGSEGTLGIVTAARLELVAPLAQRAVALLGFDAVDAALAAAAAARRDLRSLSALELFFDDGLELVCRTAGLARPFAPHRCYLLVEAGAASDPAPELAAVVESLGAVGDVAVALDPGPMAALWRYREAHTEVINRLGAPHKLDVTLPAATLGAFVDSVRAVVGAVASGARTWLFGHAGDGNVHVNVTGVAPDDERVDEAVLRHAAGLGGSISAEHGIGTAKRAWLALNRSPAEIDAFRAIKAALDPASIMNPAALLPPAGSS
ncbi:MAG TPA: FAD-binding oxidoreductase [Acidimicrobiales bacterium]